MAYESIISFFIVLKSFSFFVFVLIAFLASILIKEKNRSLAYILFFSTLVTIILSIMNIYEIIRIISFLLMIITSVLTWQTLKKSKDKKDKQIAFLLLLFLIIQIIAPLISSFFKTLSNY